MAKTYAQLQKEIETLSREAAQLKRKEAADVIARIKEAIQIYGLTAGDLGLVSTRGKRAGARKDPKMAAPKKARQAGAKFRDENGNTWGGRGPRPQWLRDALAAGKALQDFAVS
jgi:DNA-binding protein H-NS